MYSPIIMRFDSTRGFFIFSNLDQSFCIYSFENNAIVVLIVFYPILVSKTIWETKYLQNLCIHHTLDDRVSCGKPCGKDYSHA